MSKLLVVVSLAVVHTCKVAIWLFAIWESKDNCRIEDLFLSATHGMSDFVHNSSIGMNLYINRGLFLCVGGHVAFTTGNFTIMEEGGWLLNVCD